MRHSRPEAVGRGAILYDFVVDASTTDGRERRTYEAVVALDGKGVDRLLGCRSPHERVRLLRKLRDESGIVVCRRGRLTQTVRAPDGGRFRAYVFAVPHPDYVRLAADKLRHPERYRS